jgi:hypothetical protein
MATQLDSYHDPLNTLLWTAHPLPCRLGTLVITVTVLNTVHHSPLLAVCAALTGAAAYLQATYVSPAPVLHLYCTMCCGILQGGMAGVLCAMSCYCRWTPS